MSAAVTFPPAPAMTKGSAAPAARGASGKSGPLDAAGIAAEFSRLDCAPTGLTSADATARLAQYGPNLIIAHEESRWQKLLAYFVGPMPFMIEAAALISLVRSDWGDFAVIMAMLLYNA